MGQRKARLLQCVTNDSAESKRLRGTIDGMHMDMGRLNDLISRSGRRVHELDDTTRALEKEFIEELRELEVCTSAFVGLVLGEGVLELMEEFEGARFLVTHKDSPLVFRAYPSDLTEGVLEQMK